MIPAISFLGGLVGLLIGGHFVITAASSIGARFGLTPMVIGLTIVAGGTSAPELAVVSQSIAADDTELAVGSIIGSNIANVLLVLGLAAVFGTIHVTIRVVRVDIPIMIGASVSLLLMTLDGVLTRWNGLVLVGMLAGFIVWTLRATPTARPRANEVDRVGDQDRSQGLGAATIWLLAGIGALVVAARFVVSGPRRSPPRSTSPNSSSG